MNFKKASVLALACMLAGMNAGFAAMTGDVLGNVHGGAYINGSNGGFNGFTNPDSNTAVLNFSGNAAINWRDLNVAQGQLLQFLNGNNIVLNSVTGGNMSTFAGLIKADSGQIIISNPAGILFAGGQFISSGPLTLTTEKIDSLQGVGGAAFQFNNPAAGSPCNIVLDSAKILADGQVELITKNGADFIGVQHAPEGKITVDNSEIDAQVLVMNADGDIEVVNSSKLNAPNGVNLYSTKDITVENTQITGDLIADAQDTTKRFLTNENQTSDHTTKNIRYNPNNTHIPQSLKDKVAFETQGKEKLDGTPIAAGSVNASMFGLHNGDEISFDANGNLVASGTGVYNFVVSSGGVSVDHSLQMRTQYPNGFTSQAFELNGIWWQFQTNASGTITLVQSTTGNNTLEPIAAVTGNWKTIDTIKNTDIRTYDEVIGRGNVMISDTTINGNADIKGADITLSNVTANDLKAAAFGITSTANYTETLNSTLTTTTEATDYNRTSRTDGEFTYTTSSTSTTDSQIATNSAPTAPAASGTITATDVSANNMELVADHLNATNLSAAGTLIARTNTDYYQKPTSAILNNINAGQVDLIAFDNNYINTLNAGVLNVYNAAYINEYNNINANVNVEAVNFLPYQGDPARFYPARGTKIVFGNADLDKNLKEVIGDNINGIIIAQNPIAFSAEDDDAFQLRKVNYLKLGKAKQENNIIHVLEAFKAY